MSQYPSPYPPQQPPPPQYPYNFDYYQPQSAADPLGPARRASVLMYVLGALAVLGGVCCAGVGAMFSQIVAQQPELLSEMSAAAPGVEPELLQVVLVVLGAIVAVVGIGMIVLGYFVRGGGLVPVILGIVVAAIGILYFVINFVVALSGAGGGGGGAGNPGQLGLTLCFMVVPLALFVLLTVWLVQAARNAGTVRAMKQQYQAQMWQYAQQHQAYAQGGYAAGAYGAAAPPQPGGYAPQTPAPGGGYGAPPPPPPPAPTNTGTWPPPPPPRGGTGGDDEDGPAAQR